MFIIDLHYTAPLRKIDESMGAHMKFLNTHYHNKVFITSGRKVPRTGGIIIARGKSLQELTDIMNEDPFCKMNLAEYRITEFLNSQSSPEFKAMIKLTESEHS